MDLLIRDIEPMAVKKLMSLPSNKKFLGSIFQKDRLKRWQLFMNNQ
ncbi:hypothetical protein P4T04_10110 [Bacillus badius]|nr:hypothetical protein [Bacillus badius]